MGIRRYDINGTSGYGVLGDVYTNADIPIRISLQSEAFAAWQLYKSVAPSNFGKYACHISMRWRLSVQVEIYNDAKLQQYNTKIGKFRVGTAVISAYNYVTDEVFISYDAVKSPAYWGAFEFLGNDADPDDLPCDEPQIDSPSLFFGSGGAMFYSNSAPASINVPGSWSAPIFGNIGDSAIVALEPAIAVATIGCTYVYRVFPYSLQGWQDEQEPPLVIV